MMMWLRAGRAFAWCLVVLAIVGTAAGAEGVEWTYMVYMGGDNNLSNAAIADIEEMRAATSSGNVNVIVQVELGPNYSFSLPDWSTGYDTYRLKIQNGSVNVVDGNLGNLNMGDPAVLRDFVAWAASGFPATKYALTIWDHGSGWKAGNRARALAKGAVQDETSGSYMSLADLGRGVRDSSVHLDLLDFDACLMGMYEVAYEFVGAVDVLVAAEDVEPGAGNPYTAILNGLAANPAMGEQTLGALIVREFVDSYRGGRQNATKSALDIARVPELHNRIRNLAQALRNSLAVNAPAIANARAQAQSYYEKGNLDLFSLLGNLANLGGDIGSLAADLASFVRSSVVLANDAYSSSYSEGGVVGAGNVDQSNGVAIFFPSVDLLRQGEFARYETLASNGGGDGWSAFLKDFLNGTGGSGGEVGEITVTAGGFAYGIVWLDLNDDLGWTDVDLYMIEPDGTVGAPWMGESTPNGYFSPDSADSGYALEMYGAKEEVMRGDYLVVVNYYDDYWSPTWWEDRANVFLAYMDPRYGVDAWQLNPGEFNRWMSLWYPAPDVWTDEAIMGIILGWYSDWWIPAMTTRNDRVLDFERLKEILLQAKAVADARHGRRTVDNLRRLFDLYRRGSGAPAD